MRGSRRQDQNSGNILRPSLYQELVAHFPFVVFNLTRLASTNHVFIYSTSMHGSSLFFFAALLVCRKSEFAKIRKQLISTGVVKAAAEAIGEPWDGESPLDPDNINDNSSDDESEEDDGGVSPAVCVDADNVKDMSGGDDAEVK